MKAARTFTFLAVFVSVFAAFCYLKIQDDFKKDELLELAKSQVLFPNSISDEINYLSFERPSKTSVILKREGANWMIASPVKVQSDLMVVQGIIAALRFGKKEEVFETEESSDAYGFKKPVLRLSVGTKKSHRKQVLVLGDKAPIKKLYYAKWEGTTKVFLISEKLWKSFDRDLLGLRKRLALDFDPFDLKGFRISRAGRTFDIVKDDGGWSFAKNSPHGNEAVDPTEVTAYIELLRSVVVSDFLDEADWKEDQYGIRLRQNFVNVYFHNSKPQILYIGYPSREVTGTYVHMDNVFNLALIHSKVARRLDRDPASFYERRIWRDSDKEINRVSIQTGGRNLDFVLEGEKWRDQNNALLGDEKRQWLENTVHVIQELKYLSTYESNLKESSQGSETCNIKLFSIQDGPDKPSLEINVAQEKSKIEAIANSILKSGGVADEEKYNIFKLNSKDGEILSDIVRNLM